MIQRNEKLLNGMIPRKSGRDAISVGKVSQDEQTVAGTRGEEGVLQTGQWKCWAACVGRSGPVSCVHVPSNASLLVFPFHCWGPHYFTPHDTHGRAGEGSVYWTITVAFTFLCFTLLFFTWHSYLRNCNQQKCPAQGRKCSLFNVKMCGRPSKLESAFLNLINNVFGNRFSSRLFLVDR